jgi:hypothetical protein
LERKARFPALCSKAPEMRPEKAEKNSYVFILNKRPRWATGIRIAPK